MPFTVPNATDLAGSVIAALDQAEPDSLDFQALGNRRSAHISGGGITNIVSAAGTSQYVTVTLAAGEYLIDGTFISVPSSSVTLDAAPAGASARFDMIVAFNDGGVGSYAVVKGTASSTNPIFPAVTSSQVPVWAIYVKSGFDVSALNKIYVDKRVSSLSSFVRRGSGAPSGSTGAIGDLYVRSDLSTTGRQSQLYVKVDATTWENLAEFAELTGDVTSSGAATTIASGAVTSEKLGPTEVVAVRSGTPISLGLTDANKMIRVSSGRVDLPSNTTTAFPVGTNLHFMATTTTRITIAAGAGATVNSSIGATIATRTSWSVATAIKIATNDWIVFGDVAP